MSFIDITGRVAVVTGGAQGIGLAIAKRLVTAGAIVAIADINLSGAQEFISGLVENNAAAAFDCDVSDSNSVQRMIEVVLKTYAHIDILVNNAGIVGRTAPIQDQSDEDWHRMLEIDLSRAGS